MLTNRCMLCRIIHETTNFKIFARNFDCRLIMRDATRDLVKHMLHKMRSILRMQWCHSITGIINLNRANLLYYAIYLTLTVYNVCVFLIHVVDNVQRICFLL